MKKILILGANPETVSLIQKAKEIGIYTIVTDYAPNAYAKKFADMALNIDAADVEKLKDFVIREQVAGIVVGVAEALLPAYCKLCEAVGMYCYSSEEKFKVMVRKDYFKAECKKYGVPIIREYTLEEVTDDKFPIIVKPVDSCSSKGIRVCESRKELEEAIPYALSFSKSRNFIIEEYMTGDEVISYYVMQDGNPIFVGMCDRYTYKERKGLVQLPTSYIFPSKHIDSYMEKSDQAVKNMIRGLGLNNGSIFFQAFVDKEGIVRVYEPGYRLNGAQEHIIVSKVSGIDAKELYINYALTGRVSDQDLQKLSNPKPKQISCKLSPLIKTGRISKIDGLMKIAALEDVVSINPSYEEGDIVSGEGTLKQIVCRFFIVSDSKEKLIDTINNIYKYLKVLDEQGESMLIGRFDTDIIERSYGCRK